MPDAATQLSCAQLQSIHIEAALTSYNNDIHMSQALPKASISNKKAKPLGAKKRKMKVTEPGGKHQKGNQPFSWIKTQNKQPLSLEHEDPKPLSKRLQVGEPSGEDHSSHNEVTIDDAQKAAKKAWNRILGQGEAVTFQKVVEEMLLALKCPCLKLFGFCIDDVPCLQRLAWLETKVTNVILCHLAVRNVTTLHDLNLDILSAEGIRNFHELRIGPLALHPSVTKYFSLPKGFKVNRLTACEVIGYLSEYSGKDVARNIQLTDFLSYIKNRRNVTSVDQLCVHIRDFGLLVSQIRCQKVACARLARKKDGPDPCKVIAAAKSQNICTTKSLVTSPQKQNPEELLIPDFHEFSETIVEKVSVASLMQEETQVINLSSREQICSIQSNTQQMVLDNRLGEAIVFHSLVERYGPKYVTWVNAETESGLPYDIIVKELHGQSLILVKVTWSEKDDWFEISNHEWELATDNDLHFIIVRVFLSDVSGFARLVWLSNPSKLGQEGKIKLALAVSQCPPVGVNE